MLDRILCGALDDDNHKDDNDNNHNNKNNKKHNSNHKEEDKRPHHRYHRAILVNNADTLGTVGKAFALPSLQALQRDVDLNFTTDLWLSTLSAATGWQSISLWSTSRPSYCAGKAAWYLFHATLEAKHPEQDGDDGLILRVLNYSPLACNTDIQDSMRKSEKN